MSKGPFSKIIAPSIGNNPAFLPGVQSQILNHDQAAEPWQPDDEGLILWLKAENYNGTTWTDLGPNNYTATLTSTGASPSLQNNVVNGQPVVRFTGGKFFSFASGVNVITEANPYTLVVVFKAPHLANGDYGSLVSMQTKVNAQQFFFIQNFDPTGYGTITSGGGVGNPGGTGPNLYDLDYYTSFVAVVLSYAGGNFNTLTNYSWWVNNIVAATLSGGVNNSTAGGSVIGSLDTAGNGRLVGDIAELIVFDSALDATAIANLNTYLYDLYLTGTDGSWTPVQIPNVYCYFDADQSAVADAAGTAAMYLTDLTGQRHGIDTTTGGTPTAGKPLIVPSSLNGQPALDFSDGGAGGRIGTALDVTVDPDQPFSLGFVVHPNSFASTNFSAILQMSGDSAATSFTVYYGADDAGPFIPFNFCLELGITTVSLISRDALWNYDTPHSVIVNYNGAGDYYDAANFEVLINGASVVLAQSTSSGSNQELNWLGNQGDPPNVGPGLIYSFVFVKDANIAGNDLTNLLSYWNTRFGV